MQAQFNFYKSDPTCSFPKIKLTTLNTRTWPNRSSNIQGNMYSYTHLPVYITYKYTYEYTYVHLYFTKNMHINSKLAGHQSEQLNARLVFKPT